MFLFQILVPVDQRHRHQSKLSLYQIKHELTQQFGGVTVYAQSLAEGLWEDARRIAMDRIAIIEVMSKTRKLRWWRHYKGKLEARLEQKEIVIRYSTINSI
jgi:K+-sensing histidine kinase KdpD